MNHDKFIMSESPMTAKPFLKLLIAGAIMNSATFLTAVEGEPVDGNTSSNDSAPEQAPDPEVHQPVPVVRKFWEEVWNKPYNYDLIDELAAEDFVIHTSQTQITSRPAFKDWVISFQRQIKNLKFTIDDIFVGGDDKVVTRWTCTGLNNGMFGSEPDGRPVVFTGITITQVKNGKMVEKWVERSAWELFRNTFMEETMKKAGAGAATNAKTPQSESAEPF